MTNPLQFSVPSIQPPFVPRQQDTGGSQAGDFAQLLLALRGQQLSEKRESRLAESESLSKFSVLSELIPGILETETGQGLLRDAGIDPKQVIAARKEGEIRRKTAIETTLQRVPEEWQPVIGTLINLHDVVDLPAEVKTDIVKSMLPKGVDHQAFLRFLGSWRTGVLTAQQAAEVAGLTLPPGFPLELKIPKLSSTTAESDKRLQRLSKEMTALNTLIDNARIELDRERARIDKQVGIFEVSGRRVATQDQENMAANRLNRFQAGRFPGLNKWRRRSEEIQRAIQELIESRPTRVESEAGREPDELDKIIEEERRAAAPPRR